MTLWRAVTYCLFTGDTGRPAVNIWIRAGLFGSGLVLVGTLGYRMTPHFVRVYPKGQLLALLFVLCMSGIMLVGVLADTYQRAFLTKLHVLRFLPLPPVKSQLIHGYAQMPINLAAMVLIVSALLSVYAGNGPWYGLIVASVLFCSLAIAGDVVMRMSAIYLPVLYMLRIALLMVLLYFVHMLVGSLDDNHQLRYVAATGCVAICYSAVIYHLARQPAAVHAARFHTPVVEGRLSIMSALPVRALRTARYMGTNIVLALISLMVLLAARSQQSFLPLDGIVVVALLLIGTLGQEARALSRVRYPLELSLYGSFGAWLAATWTLAVIHGCIWIDICLAIVRLWSSDGLSVGYAQAGFLGISFIAAGIVAGSVIVPQKHDILAQCASTAVYGLLVWLVIKLSTVPFAAHMPLLQTAGVVMLSLTIAGLCEYVRWHKTIKIRRTYAK